MLTRRNIITGITAGTAMAVMGCKNTVGKAVNRISSVGIQTYTLRDIFEESPLETLKLIKDAGYDYVELNARNFEIVEAPELRGMLDDIGLPAHASHISIDMIKGDLAGLIQTANTLGLKYLVIPYISEDQRTLNHWKAHTKLMNEAGRVIADNGLTLAYHNHQFEFDDLGGGVTANDIILGESAPENLAFEIDLFWAALANADIAALFNKYPGRFKLCHIKDMGPNRADFANADYNTITRDLMQNVGEGILNFEDIFAMNDISGLEYFIAEHDQPKKPYLQSIQTSLKTIRGFEF